MRRNNLFLAVTLFVFAIGSTAFINSTSSKKHQIQKEERRDTIFPVFVKALGHNGKNAATDSGVISFRTGLSNLYFQHGALSRSGYLYLETKVLPFINKNIQKVPLNLSVVIDRSGSMAGKKMEYALKAAKQIIEKLTAEDFVSVVIYDQEVSVLHPSSPVTDKETIKTKIDGIEPRGSTNLWGGTEKGYEEVKKNYKPNYINRVLLISDGLANSGLTHSGIINKKVQQFKDIDGITLSSFGVGLDYNEVLMTAMAEKGSGNYYFIDAPDKMASIFEKEMNGLQNIAAQNGLLTIKVPQDIQIQKIYASNYEQKNNEISIKFRDLFSEETKGILLHFNIPNSLQSNVQFTSTLSFDDLSDGRKKTITHENLLKPADMETYLSHFNEQVMQQIILLMSNESLELAMLETDKKNYDGARKIIKANQNFLQVNKEYVSRSKELLGMDSTINSYLTDLQMAEKADEESIKRFQKTKREQSYKLRNKKQ